MSRSLSTLPVLTGDGNLAFYLQEIRKYPVLEPHEEYMLAKSWQEHEDVTAAHKLVTSHLRLVAKIARGYRGYGLPLSDLISEGTIGMMQAVKRFDPDRGFRLATYAMWWIKAAIQEYVLKSWSLVKMGTTASQKKLFFNLHRLKRQMKAIDRGDMTPEDVTKIADTLVVSEKDVVSMNRRLIAGDQSLNAPIGGASEGYAEWQDWLEDERDSQEMLLGAQQEMSLRQRMLAKAMDSLKPREREIIAKRRLAENPQTLEVLSQHYGVSRERIRQIEERAFERLQEFVQREASEQGLLPSPDTFKIAS